MFKSGDEIVFNGYIQKCKPRFGVERLTKGQVYRVIDYGGFSGRYWVRIKNDIGVSGYYRAEQFSLLEKQQEAAPC